MNRVYFLVFNRNVSIDYEKLKETIDKDPGIEDWWHFLTSAYIIVSSYSADALTDKLRASLPVRYIIVELTKNNYQGYLPEKAWEWIKKYL